MERSEFKRDDTNHFNDTNDPNDINDQNDINERKTMIAYFDCFSGISGDMTLGSFLDLGVPVEWLKDQLGRLPLAGFDVCVDTVSRNGIAAKRVQVRIADDTTSRDHAQIRSLITKSPLSQNIKQMSLNIFERIAQAEAVIHGCTVDQVHFHEVGGIDAIVDIVGAALCMDYLEIKTVIASHIPLGKGFVSCDHGTLPVPAPATLGILKGVPVYGTKIPHELVTPTGAAILVTLAESYGELPDMIIEKTGYGAGKRELESMPNLLRIIMGTGVWEDSGQRPSLHEDTIVVLETCIDNMNPEVFGFLMDRLFEHGALDVYWIPAFMKKNRPGTLVQVLCRRNLKKVLIDCILSETSTLGIRYYDAKRCLLTRETVIMKTAYGEIQVKRITEPGGSVRIVPEYEVCKTIALENKLPIRVVYDTIMKSLSAY